MSTHKSSGKGASGKSNRSEKRGTSFGKEKSFDSGKGSSHSGGGSGSNRGDKNKPKRYVKRGGRKPQMRSKRDRQISIVFEDNDFLVASKPSGLLSVPIPKMQSANLLEALNEELSVHNEKAITVHRIDRFTSGLVVFAKNSLAHKNLVKQFLGHTPKRTYLALVRGVVPAEEGELIHYLKKITTGFRNIVVDPSDPEGAMARLTFKVLERYANTTLVQINLDTGLKNQIRVQFAEYGHPLVGDRHYAPAEAEEELIDRQALHSWKLELSHPKTGKTMEFEADWPTDLRRVIQHYKKE